MPVSATSSKKSRSVIVQNDFAIRIVQVWLLLGVVAIAVCPSLRGSNEWFGWLPFWLVVAPLVDWLILRRSHIAALSRHAVSRRSLPRFQHKPVVRRAKRSRTSPRGISARMQTV